MSLVQDLLSPENQENYKSHSINTRLVIKDNALRMEKLPRLYERFWKRALYRNENRDSWQFFKKKILTRSFQDQKKIQKIFANHGIEMETLIASGRSLKKKHIDLALIALGTLYISDLGENPHKLGPLKIAQKIDEMSKNIFSSFSWDHLAEGIWAFLERVFMEPITREKEKLKIFQELGSFRRSDSYFEYLTKTVATSAIEEGVILPGPGAEDFYQVYKTIQYKGLIAYALKPVWEHSKLEPILFFRPTQIALSADNAFDTFVDDLDKKAVGYTSFQKASASLDALMEDPGFRKEGQKISVAGFSLGGAHAQYFLAHKDNWKWINQGLFFNDPAVDQKSAKVFAEKINSLPKEVLPPAIAIFRTENDPVDHAGDHHVGFGVSHPKAAMTLTTHFVANPLTSRVDRHTGYYRDLGLRSVVSDLTDKENHYLLNNKARGKEVYSWEKTRKWLVFFSPLILAILSLLIYLNITKPKKIPS